MMLIAALCVALTPGCRLIGGDRASGGAGDPIAQWREAWTPELRARRTAQLADQYESPEDPMALIVAAQERLANDDQEGARQLLEQAVGAAAGDATVLLSAGSISLDLDPDRGLALMRDAISAAPNDPVYRISLARSLEDAGQPEEALAELKAGVEAIPDDHDLRLEYAAALIGGGDAGTAERVLTDPMELWLDLPGETWDAIANARPDAEVMLLVGQDRLRAARSLIDDTMRQIAQRHRLLASAAVLRGDIARAAQEYERSIEGRRNWATQLRLADVRVALGEEDAAKEAYLGIPPRQARPAQARLERWDRVGFEAFSAEMKQFITEHARDYAAPGRPPDWSVP